MELSGHTKYDSAATGTHLRAQPPGNHGCILTPFEDRREVSVTAVKCIWLRFTVELQWLEH